MTTPSSISKLIRSWNSRLSSPLEPFTVTCAPSILTSTPEGTVTGMIPIRLISPHLADDLAAETPPPRLTVGKQTLAGGHNCHAETTLDTG